MERNYMRADSLVELDFTSERHTDTHRHENFELLFVISGRMSITIGEDLYRLSTGDMVVVNVDQKHSYDGNEELVMGRFVISDAKVRELLGLNHVLFWCNSTVDRNEAYNTLRQVIVKIFNQVVRKSGKNQLYISSMYYQLLHILTENFTLAPNDRRYEPDKGRNDDRVQQILAYIRANYRKNITLDDIAKYFYLTPTYVSKYIKQKCNINFMDLLNSVRLSHAMEDLIYSDDSIMKIALENGFASVAAYNKAFKETYHMTPSEFRKQCKPDKKQTGEEENRQEQLIKQRVEEFLDKNPGQQDMDAVVVSLDAGINMDAPAAAEWDRCTCKMINAGTAVDLMNVTFQEQILAHQEQMGFEYVRFWDIYSPELYIDIHAPEGVPNFTRLNAVTDFLVNHHLKPYIELGFKSRRLLSTANKVLKVVERNEDFDSDEEMRLFYQKLIWHFIKRYGSREVGDWYFELWENLDRHEEFQKSHRYTAMTEQQHRAYFHRFTVIAGALRSYLPEVKIGGGGFPIRFYGEEGFAGMLTAWNEEPQKPDFLSLSCFPYQQELQNGIYYEKRSTDMDFVHYNIDSARNVMKKTGFPKIPVHVTEYSLSLSNRNALNDSCLKGAFMLSNTFSCLGKADMLGHWLFTDAYADERDAKTVLFGGCGLLTKDGIPKPGYYALEFLNHLYPRVQKLHPNYMITRNERGSLRLVCHNLKKPNFSYYMTKEDELEIRNLPGILDNREFLTVHLKADGMVNGVYTIKHKQMNSHHGSVQDKWISLNMESELTKDEMDYLRMISICEISISETEVNDHRLEMDIVLEPNEIRYIHIFRKQTEQK
ncbi:MAG: helix-turn-helix domain-containing protein [Lachnospiraceae bacterium]